MAGDNDNFPFCRSCDSRYKHSIVDGLQELRDPKLQCETLQSYNQLAIGMLVYLMIDEGFGVFHLRPEHACVYEFADEAGCEKLLPADIQGCVGLLTKLIEIRCVDHDKLIPLQYFGITDTYPGDFVYFNLVIAEWQHNGETYTLPADLLAASNA